MHAEVPSQPLQVQDANVITMVVGEHRYRMYLPNQDTDYIQHKIVVEQRPYELEMLEDIRQRVKTDDLVLDIGANIGNHSLYLAAVAGCRVVAFEPNQKLAKALLSSVELNNLAERVDVKALALGAARSAAHFEQELPDNLGGQSIALGEGSIEVLPLDELDFAHRVKLLKIDVEGMELSVLKGALGLLRNDRPIIYVECQSEKEFRPLAAWLESQDYSYWDTYNATPTHLFLPSEQIDMDRRLSHLQLKEALSSYRNSEQLSVLRRQLNEANTKYRKITEQAAQLKTDVEAARSLAADRQKKIVELVEDKHRQVELLDAANTKYRKATEQAALLKADLEALRSLAADTQKTIEELVKDKHLQVQRLDATNAEYRNITEQFALLKTDLEAVRSLAAAKQKKIEELTESLRLAEDKRHQAEQRVIKTRASLTYQFGYQLKCGVSSVTGFLGLPRALFKLYREASGKRRSRPLHSIGGLVQVEEMPVQQQLGGSPIVVNGQPPDLLESARHARSLMAPRASANPVRVACIMDEFSYRSYRHECDLLQLTPANWRRELADFRPELVLIESAWRGKDDLWGSKIGHNSQELRGILEWCRSNGVPTAFWNKEDPVHFEGFLTTAKQFDYVFTTDIDCIHRYKASLGHGRVYLLPFACQPAVHNPIELYQRKDAFCFAGAYYAKYPDRIRDLQTFVAELPKFRPLEIYDRNFGKDDPNHQFPGEYHPYIMGNLPFDQIERAYKGYRYAINLNSVKQSQSMFARRLFELLGSNTITVSNFSRGARLLFGDLVISTDNGPEMLRRLALLTSSEENCAKLRLAGLRKVMQDHTYSQRIDYVCSKMLQRPPQQRLPAVTVFGHAEDATALDCLLASLKRQKLQPLYACILVSATLKAQTSVGHSWLELVTEDQIEHSAIGDLAGGAGFIAGMSSEDYYGPNYLLDIALTTRYCSASVVGKGAYFAWESGRVRLHGAVSAYSPVSSLSVRASAIEICHVAGQSVLDWFSQLEDGCYRQSDALAIDAYNYCRSGACVAVVPGHVDDLTLDTGLPIDELQARAEAIPPSGRDTSVSAVLTGVAIEALFGRSRGKGVTLSRDGEALKIVSPLADGNHEYIYSAHDLDPAVLGDGEKLKLFLEATPGLNLQLVLLILDAQKQRITHVMGHANSNISANVPPETAFIRLGFRVYGSGSTEIKGLLLGHRDVQPAAVLERSRRLLLTNHYPAYGDLYRNGFVHSRVRAYREKGVAVEVFRLRKDHAVSYHEFENVDVITGSQELLDRMLAEGRFDTVLVHFLDSDMWKVLRKYTDHIQVVVWVHGAEIQPWWRREYNYNTEDQLQMAKLESDKRQAFWRELLHPMPPNVRLVFVSRYFAEEVMEDLGFRLPEAQYSIIHNPIDTGLFSYQLKSREQRCKILSIRPYASAKYANDLSVKAIQMLAERPFFRDLEFRMIGDGPLFDELLQPLRKYPNVIIERGFLKQPQIAALHKDYGVFLCPTRMDAQGVSRDEAMSSGLVPVTNGVTAIPEFVDDSCGILAAEESAEELAEGIAKLYLHPELFEAMSHEAAQRVRRQTGQELIVTQELIEIHDRPMIF